MIKKNYFLRYTTAAVLIGLLFLIGCTIKIGKASFGYSTSGASISPEIKTVSVQYFQNRSTLVEPGMAQRLTEKLKDKILAQTSLKIVNGMGDVNFEGTIESYGTSPMAVSGGNNAVAQQNRLTLGIKVKYNNTKEPLTDFEASFSRYRDYNSQLSLNDAEAKNLDDIFNDLVEDVFNKAFVNW